MVRNIFFHYFLLNNQKIFRQLVLINTGRRLWYEYIGVWLSCQ